MTLTRAGAHQRPRRDLVRLLPRRAGRAVHDDLRAAHRASVEVGALADLVVLRPRAARRRATSRRTCCCSWGSRRWRGPSSTAGWSCARASWWAPTTVSWRCEAARALDAVWKRAGRSADVDVCASWPSARAAPRMACRRDTDAFRWVDGELPGVDGGPVRRRRGAEPATATRTPRGAARSPRPSRSVLAAQAVYLKRRPREARRAVNEDAGLGRAAGAAGGRAVAVARPCRGARAALRDPPRERALGGPVPRRPRRAGVGAARRRRAARVLNRFSYTCGFGVAAGKGGAARAVNVDASRKVLEWGEANAELNGLRGRAPRLHLRRRLRVAGALREEGASASSW